jgi:hypothetical protein
MKKTFLTAALLLTVALAQAQAFMKVTPTLKVGEVKTYVTESKTVTKDGTKTKKSEIRFSVLKEMAEGFIVEVLQTKEEDKKSEDVMERLASLDSELLLNQPVRLVISKEGLPVGIASFPQLKQMLTTKIGFVLNDLYTQKPEIAQQTPKDTLLNRIAEGIEVDKILKDYTTPGNVMSLNGKTIVIGFQENFDLDGIKMKRTLMPTGGGKSVMEMLTSDMTPEDFKALIMKQLEKADEASKKEAEAQIDEAIKSGLLSMKAGGKGTYNYGDDFWPTSITQDIDIEQAGEKVTINEVTTLKK